jgi:transcriptional/translational regulatory protein YebC/TACO1
MAEVGSVAWQFNHIAYFAIDAEGKDFDRIFELAVESGADDITSDDDTIEIFAPLDSFKAISDSLKKAGIETEEETLQYTPKQEMALDTEKTIKVMRVIEDLEELDDVQNVYSNLQITEEAIQELQAA